jgi:hypothetical protein
MVMIFGAVVFWARKAARRGRPVPIMTISPSLISLAAATAIISCRVKSVYLFVMVLL